MKYNSLIIGLSVLALQSCTDKLIYTEPGNEAILTGNTYKAAFTENSSADQSFTLNSGSRILLNASGSLQINNEVLTYIDNQWKAGNEFDWTSMVENTNITALYPVYPDLAYTKENLYRDESLEDILYVNDEFPAGIPINLQFKHLFSLLTLHVDEKLQTDFQKIEVTCPLVVSSIEPESVQMILETNEAHTSSITQISSSGNYSFIVPPAENVTISIDIHTNGKKYSTLLQSKSFIGNQEYIYNLKTSEKTPGIVTAEDWIAFSRLINHNNITEYNGKTLNDFGEIIDGAMTYRLLNDIDFEGVDCTNLEHVGSYLPNDGPHFSGIFDGQGYIISNLTPVTKWATTGLFGAIDRNSIIKNLHVKSCNVSITKNSNSTAQGTSILVGYNKGKILNCSVEDCKITANPTDRNQSAYTGGVAGTSTGQIINCYVKNINIDYSNKSKINAKPAGGLAGSSQGLILNCYSTNNIIKNRGSYNGGICGEVSKAAHIENCYVYSIDQVATKGLLAGKADNSFFSHNCYYNTTVQLIGQNTQANQISENIKYTNTFTDEAGIPIYQLLNQWIDETAPTLYPNYTFIRWTDGNESLPAVFVTEAQRH